MINCKETLSRFYEYLDSELSGIQAEDVKNHLEACRECFDRMEFERSFGAFVKDQCSGTVEADAMKSKILARIGELECASEDEVLFPAEGATQPESLQVKRRIPAWSYMLAAAAVVLLAVPFFEGEEHLPFEDPVLMNFLSLHTESQPEMMSNDPLALTDWVAQHVNYDPMISRFVDAGCEVEGAAINDAWTHLFLQEDEVDVSVFVGNSDDFKIPAEMELITIDDHAFWTREVDGYSVVVWESACDGVICAAVAKAGIDRVVNLAHRVSNLDMGA